MLLFIALTLLTLLGVISAPTRTAPGDDLAARQQTRYTIKWASQPSLFFEFDQIFTTPIYTPTRIKNGIKPYVGPDAPKFFYRYWSMNPGAAGPIYVTGTLGERKCLDAGSNPGNGVQVHMWDCYDGLTQQQWVVENGRIKLRDRNLCLDVPNGQPSSNYAQVWECTWGPNQQWTVSPV